MSDPAGDAIRRWWFHDKPALERELRKLYSTAHFSDETVRMLHYAAGQAFRAGWRARGLAAESAGRQESLLPTDVEGS